MEDLLHQTRNEAQVRSSGILLAVASLGLDLDLTLGCETGNKRRLH